MVRLVALAPKYWILILLVVQNSTLTLVLHYTRVVAIPGKVRYLASTSVLLVELVKLAISLAFTLREEARINRLLPVSVHRKTSLKSILSGDSYKLAVPATFYTIQSYLVYTAISNLSAATFQVTYQFKILTTVIFSIILLKKPISLIRWLALVLLTIGIIIVQIPQLGQLGFGKKVDDEVPLRKIAGRSVNDGALDATKTSMNTLKGLTAVVAASVISGFTSVYFEKVVKESLASVSIWSRNVQLSLYSLVPAIFGLLYNDGNKIYHNGFFVGYSGLVWMTIALQAIGGLIVAVCIVQVDNVVKNFAVSISIVVSFLVEVFVFKSAITMNFLCGTPIVLLATYLYVK